jgi:predicted small secreted protein
MTINNKKSLVIAVISALCATIASASAVTEMMSASKENGQEILKRSE